MVGIERFDKERSDEEPCETSRQAKCRAVTAPQNLSARPGVERLKSAKSKKRGGGKLAFATPTPQFCEKEILGQCMEKRQKKWSCNDRVIGATLFEAAKSHKTLVINVVYSRLRTRVLTALFALLILRSPKYSLKSKGLALFRHHRHHLTERFSTPKAASLTEDGGNSGKNEPGLSVFTGFSQFPHFIDAAPLSRSDLLPPDSARHFPHEGKNRKVGPRGIFRSANQWR